MAGIPMPGEDVLPEGPWRTLIAELHQLYESAGSPGIRRIAAETRRRDDLGDAVSNEVVARVLHGGKVPRWSALEVVVRVLAGWSTARPDPDEMALRFHTLWRAVEAARTGDDAVPSPNIPQDSIGFSSLPNEGKTTHVSSVESHDLNHPSLSDTDLSGHPVHLSDSEAVATAYSVEINQASSYLNAGLSILIGSDKALVVHLAAEIGARSGRRWRVVGDPDASHVGDSSRGHVARRAWEELMAALQEALAAATGGDIVVVPQFGMLASSDQNALASGAHELTDLLYQYNDRIILAFAGPFMVMPQALADRFAAKTTIDILPREVMTRDYGPVPIGQALITKAEAELFEDFDAATLYPYIAGMNAVRLRDAIHFMYYHFTAGGAHRQEFAYLLEELRVFKARGSIGFEVPNVPMKLIGGYDEVKTEIAQVLKIFAGVMHGSLPEVLRHDLLSAGLLFHGPPGTGKTLFTKAIASHLRATLLMVSGPEITDMYTGHTIEGARNLHDLFAAARRNAPAVLVIDKFDSIAGMHTFGDDSGGRTGNAIVAQLLTELDGFRAAAPVLVIGTTNRLDLIDTAMLRPSRFRPIMIGLPDEHDRRAIAEVHAQHFAIEHTPELLDAVAAATDGMNGDEIRSIFRDARSEALAGGYPVNAEQLRTLIQKLRAEHYKRMGGTGAMGKRKVFISYVREDSEMIDRIAETLRAHGVDVWLDRTNIAPGERWQRAIRNAIREGHFFLACFSPSYTQRDRTYMNEELRIATEQLRLMPLSRRWFIPMILEACQVPDFAIDATDTLNSLQYIDFSRDWDSAMVQLIHAVAPQSPPE